MALTKRMEIQNNFGETSIFPDCYIKVGVVTGTKENLSFSVVCFNKKNGIFLTSQNFSFAPDLNGANFIKQAYSHLKTLPEFADAADV